MVAAQNSVGGGRQIRLIRSIWQGRIQDIKKGEEGAQRPTMFLPPPPRLKGLSMYNVL